MKKFFLLTLLLLNSGCDWPKEEAKTPQAEEINCSLAWDTLKDQMRTAKVSEGVDKIYYVHMAQMNLSIMLTKGCCKYADTCPLFVSE